MAILETALSATQDTIKGLEERVDSLEGEYADFTMATKDLIQDQANTFRGEFRAFHEELLKLCSFIQEELRVVHAKVEEVYSN